MGEQRPKRRVHIGAGLLVLLLFWVAASSSPAAEATLELQPGNVEWVEFRRSDTNYLPLFGSREEDREAISRLVEIYNWAASNPGPAYVGVAPGEWSYSRALLHLVDGSTAKMVAVSTTEGERLNFTLPGSEHEDLGVADTQLAAELARELGRYFRAARGISLAPREVALGDTLEISGDLGAGSSQAHLFLVPPATGPRVYGEGPPPYPTADAILVETTPVAAGRFAASFALRPLMGQIPEGKPGQVFPGETWEVYVQFDRGEEYGLAFSIKPPRQILLLVNGELVATDVPPEMQRGRVLVPVRAIAEALGLNILWDGESQQVLVNTSREQAGPGREGEITVWIYGRQLATDVPPVMRQGRVLVPVRAIAEALGAQVEWLPAARTVKVDLVRSALAAQLGLDAPGSKSFAWSFVEPRNWRVERTPGRPLDAFDFVLDKIAAALGQAEVIDGPRPEGEETARYGFFTEIPTGSGSASFNEVAVTVTGRYAEVRVPPVSDRPEAVYHLWFPDDALNRAIHELEALLPPPFPTLEAQVTDAGPATVVTDLASWPRELVPVPHHLPAGEVRQLLPGPARDPHVLYALVDVPGTPGEVSRELYRSPDDGWHWERVDWVSHLPAAPVTLAWAPHQPDLVLAGGEDGNIYRSLDGGNTWEAVWKCPDPEAAYKYPVTGFLFAQDDPRFIYAVRATDTRHPGDPGVLASADGGETWDFTGVNGSRALIFGQPGPALYRDPYQPVHLYLTGSVRQEVNTRNLGWSKGPGLLHSPDRGNTWEFITFPGELLAAGRLPVNDAWQTILVGQYTAGENTPGGTGYHVYLATSTDRGATWEARALPSGITSILDLALMGDSFQEAFLLAGEEVLEENAVRPVLYHTPDAGGMWYRVAPAVTGGLDGYDHLALTSSGHLYLYGPRGLAIYKLEYKEPQRDA